MTSSPTCARGFRAAHLDTWGHAPQAQFWVCLEIPGAWGRDAVTQSRHLDPELGEHLNHLVTARQGKFLLIRRTGRNTPNDAPLQVLVSGGFADGGWLHTFHVTHPRELVEWLTAWDGQALPTTSHPLILVCTNSKRDQCCSAETRPVLGQLTDLGHAVWECSHLGGHRFAPTALVLPTGQMLAALEAPHIRDALQLAADGLLWPGGPRHERGRTHLPAAQQAAEAWALHRWGPVSGELLSSRAVDDHIVVQHGQHSVKLHARYHTAPCQLPLSCGKSAEEVGSWQITVD